MTIIEKIMAKASGAAKVSPGDIVVVPYDLAAFNDNISYFMEGRELLKLHDPSRIVVALDHQVPAPTLAAAEAQERGRAFIKRWGIERFHDMGADQGILHVLIADNAYALPGTILICSDSHTCSAGVMNCAARAIPRPDVIYAITTGSTWFRISETIRYDLDGKLPAGVSSKDVLMHIAGKYGHHTNLNVEFGGTGLPWLNLNARRTLTAMGAELSAEFTTFEADDVLLDHVRRTNPAPFEAQNPDADAVYRDRRQIRLDEMEPLVALPDAIVNNTVPVGQVVGTPIDQAFIGSCANGTLDDLAIAAQVVAGRRVARGVRFIVTPGSQAVYRQALKAGYIETLTDAGAIITSATCGACGGFHMGVLGPNQTCITASTRNFKGRMGDPSAKIFLASSATVAASAISGSIAHAGEFVAA